ncbi:Hypothetical_protein [Hexamita inflata]|uniref:Hypothetical_protein n=1 Tax=Hexamita inflata TaxID=28002 RepID=A0AA86QWT0_9EUKA|nr:Hypothetical protein HINF_LOCUS49867 [Hexamita inflata]
MNQKYSLLLLFSEFCLRLDIQLVQVSGSWFNDFSVVVEYDASVYWCVFVQAHASAYEALFFLCFGFEQCFPRVFELVRSVSDEQQQIEFVSVYVRPQANILQDEDFYSRFIKNEINLCLVIVQIIRFRLAIQSINYKYFPL